MFIGDSYVNLSLVSLVVFDDASTITVYYAVGNAVVPFHSGDSTAQIKRVREILEHPKTTSFLQLRDGNEFLNLGWIVRAQGGKASGQIIVTLPNGIERTYSGKDAATLNMRLM
jgi:hypothetical protein